MKKCFSCATTLDIKEKPGRGDACPSCGADVKVCLNCAFYDKNSHNGCREPSADPVLDKERANYCEYFEMKETDATAEKAADPLSELKKLFKRP